jgi:predicted ATP-dependent Lon-type protease
MTSAAAATSEMDHLDGLGAKAFDGSLVRKDLERKYSRQYPVPTYVDEFLLVHSNERMLTDGFSSEVTLE